MKKGLLWLIAIVVVLGSLYYYNQKGSETDTDTKIELDEPVKIGGILPLTGDATVYGIPIQRSALIALDEINEAGGIGGQEVQIIWEDGKCESKEASNAADKLINIDAVKFILGGACSSEALAAAPLAEEKKIILISPSATSPDVSDAGEFVFRTAPSDALAGRVAAEYAFTKKGFKNAAIISENTDYAQGLSGVFEASFKELGGAVAAHESFETGVVDFSSQILKVQNGKPDVIYLVTQTDAPAVQIIKQLQQKKITAQIITSEVLSGRDIIGTNKDLFEGIIAIEPYFDDSNLMAQAFLAKYEERYQEKPPYPYFMAATHATLFLLKEAIEANGLDTVKIQAWLENVKNWESAAGKLSFDENGDVNAAYHIFLIKDGTAETIEIYTPGN